MTFHIYVKKAGLMLKQCSVWMEIVWMLYCASESKLTRSISITGHMSWENHKTPGLTRKDLLEFPVSISWKLVGWRSKWAYYWDYMSFPEGSVAIVFWTIVAESEIICRENCTTAGAFVEVNQTVLLRKTNRLDVTCQRFRRVFAISVLIPRETFSAWSDSFYLCQIPDQAQLYIFIHSRHRR
jgi:hypothetical protein